MKKTTSGFTIVELLIVIVVIAILAAIGIMAYSGVQQRARNTQVIQGVQQYVKAIALYVSAKGQLPITSGAACLGTGYPSDQCWTGPDTLRYVNATFDTNLSEFMPNKPILATKLFQVTNGSEPYMRGGAVLNSPATGTIIFYLEGADQNCTISGAVASNDLQTTRCTFTIPTS